MYRLIARAIGLLLTVSPLSVLAQSGEATFEGLGDLPGGIFESRAFGVSGDGAVVVGRGSSEESDFEGFRWEGGEMETLGFLGTFLSTTATAASSDGSVVVGVSSLEAFRWEAAADTMEGLGFLPGAFFNSGGNAVSADGSVVVGFSNTASAVEAFRWEAATDTMVGLGNLSEQGSSRAHGVSADGSVVVGEGQRIVCQLNPDTRAFRWENDTMEDIGVLSASGCGTSRAHAISADGFVIVGGSTSEDGFQAFRWEGGDMVGLGDLPDPNGNFYSEAYAVSADGSVVVGLSSADGLETFIWTAADGIRNLRTVLEEEYDLDLTGWMLRQATGISDDGTVIVGWGVNPDGNEEAWRAFLPPPMPPENDNVADAIVVTESGMYEGANVDATTEDDVPEMSCGSGDRVDVWWSFTAEADGETTIRAEGSTPNFDAVLSLHQADDLSEVACNDDHETTGRGLWSLLEDIPVIEGETYLIRVAGDETGEDSLLVTVELPLPEPPVNDSIADAIVLTESGTYLGTNVNATLEDDEPEPSCTFSTWTTNFSVWWSFTATGNGTATIDTNGSLTPEEDGLDTILSLHNATDLSEVACDDDGGDGLQSLIEEAPVTEGEIYLIRVAGYNESNFNQGTIQLTTDFQFGIADDATPEEIAEGVSLPSPNPVSGTSTFTVAVENGQDVTVEVFDVTGRRVQTLYNAALTAGKSERFTLDASVLPAGVYVIRATGEDFTRIRRVTVVH